jgi:hypothetical protein
MNLSARFYDAFASCPRPSPEQILRKDINYGGEKIQELLARKTPKELTVLELRDQVSGELTLLTPVAFRYFLPALMDGALNSYDLLSALASELINALNKPIREDIAEIYDSLAQAPSIPNVPAEMLKSMRQEHLESFDSGSDLADFYKRFDSFTHTQGAAVLDFLAAFQEAYGEDFPTERLQKAIDNYWVQYRTA